MDLASLTAPAERLDVYVQATVLDWVIDSLADWVEAAEAPGHTARVRAEKERWHRSALAVYRERYG